MREFLLSVEFTNKLVPSTKSEYRRMLRKAETEFGDMPMAALDDPRVRREFMDWREKVAKDSGEREADNRLSAVSAMLTWALDRGKLPANHLRGFKRLYRADRADMIWLPEHVTAFMKVAAPEMQRALILALHTGQRQGDILRLAWTNYDGTAITLRQGKTGRQVVVPCTKTLRRMLDKMNGIRRWYSRPQPASRSRSAISRSSGRKRRKTRGSAICIFMTFEARPSRCWRRRDARRR